MRRLLALSWMLLLAAGLVCGAGEAGERDYQRVVVLGDPHLPGKNVAAKEGVLQTINGWGDVDLVAVLGDICEDFGTAEEYAAAKQFFAKLEKPTAIVTGNHDYVYEDAKSSRGTYVLASAATRGAKLKRFKDTFGLDEVYHGRRLGPYLLLFLSPDHSLSRYLTELSGRQLDWLKGQLDANLAVPIAIFFHAPLKGTLPNYNEYANKDNFVAQPERELRELLLRNPQVFLWVSGHTHTPATNESYAAPINVYENRVTNIHNADMNRERIWTNSLYFFPDKIVVKTYDHKKQDWLPHLERTLTPPRP